MPKLIDVRFAGYTAYLRPHHEGVRAVAPDAAGRACDLLEQAIHQAIGVRPGWGQGDTWMVSLENLAPDTCRQIAHTFQKLLLQEQRRLADLAEALGDPRPAPEPSCTEEVEDEAAPDPRMPPDPEEELRRFREEVDRMLRRRSGSAQE
jgi:hypothetical protein